LDIPLLIREYFLKCIVVSDLNSRGLVKTIIENLQSAGINFIDFFIGQGYDCAASMRGYFNCAKAVVIGT